MTLRNMANRSAIIGHIAKRKMLNFNVQETIFTNQNLKLIKVPNEVYFVGILSASVPVGSLHLSQRCTPNALLP